MNEDGAECWTEMPQDFVHFEAIRLEHKKGGHRYSQTKALGYCSTYLIVSKVKYANGKGKPGFQIST